MTSDLLILSLIFLILILLAYFVGKKVGEFGRDLYWEKKAEDLKEEAIKRSRSVLSGQFSEQLAPFWPNFPYKATECRFIGKPIDFLVFKGMDEKEIKEVIFVEIKSGESTLSTPERRLREVIKEGKVKWEEYRV